MKIRRHLVLALYGPGCTVELPKSCLTFIPEPILTAARRHVFVYGTLRRGDVRDINHLHPPPVFVSMTSVQGVLYDLGPYPCLLLGPEGRVTGEGYAISAALERQLATIEEVWPQPTGEHLKREVEVQLRESGAQVEPAEPEAMVCLVYEIDPARLRACPVIRSGDWRDIQPLAPGIDCPSSTGA